MKTYIPKNMLVTGGMGFIGSNFIRLALDKDHDLQIINLDLCTYASSKENIRSLQNQKRHTFFKGNINDRALLNKLIEEFNVDTIVHFAAESHVDKSINAPDDFIATNISGTFALLEVARNIWLNQRQWSENDCRFYHISTDEVYGSCTSINDPSFTEDSPYNPSSPYSASKAASNHLVMSYNKTYNLPMIISNCTNNYGPYQHVEKLIPKIIDCCLNAKEIPIYGDGTAIRDWLYVQDHCQAIFALLKLGEIGEEYNISANNELSNIEVINNICELMDGYAPKAYSHKQLIKFTADRPGHDWRYSLNSDKTSKATTWKPKTSFNEGLIKTIEFYMALHNVHDLIEI